MLGWHDMVSQRRSTRTEVFDARVAAGYRLTYVSGYAVGSQARYAAIWEQVPGAAWVARHGLTATQYQAEFDAQSKNGYGLVLVNGYTVGGGSTLYAALWDKAPRGSGTRATG